MSSQSITLLGASGFLDSDSQSLDTVADLGAYNSLAVQVMVLALANQTATLKLQHAAVNEEGAFQDIENFSVTVGTGGSVGPDYNFVGDFLRYVRWKVEFSSTATTAAVVSIFVIAKE